MLDSLFGFEKRLSIGIVKIGGYGDDICLLYLASAIRDKYPDAFITAYIRGRVELIAKHPAIDRLVYTGFIDWYRLSEKIKKDHVIVIDDRYWVGVFDQNGIINKETFDERYYNMFENLKEIRGNLLEKSFKTAQLPMKEKYFDLNCLISNNKMEKVMNYDYVAIHNTKSKTRATKRWSDKNWEKLVKLIGIPVVQVGVKGEGIKGTVDLTGKTTFEETASIIRGAKLFIDTESGLVHLARGLNTKSIVLFGATGKEHFGYKKNINLDSGWKCSPCWYQTSDWYKKCPKSGCNHCPALRSISYKKVASKVKELL